MGYYNVVCLKHQLQVKMLLSGNTTFTHSKPTHGTCTERKNQRTLTITKHQDDNNCKATSSLVLFKMIAKEERTLITAQQNKNQTQKPQNNGRSESRRTTTEPSH